MQGSSRFKKPHRSDRKNHGAGKRSGIGRSSRKVFDRDNSTGTHGKAKTDSIHHHSEDHSSSAITAINSPRFRRAVDIFLKNSTPVHTVFRSMLQGPDGGYQGGMDPLVIAEDFDGDSCSGCLAISGKGAWKIHSYDKESLNRMLDAITPLKLEGEADVVREGLTHPLFAGFPQPEITEYHFYELRPGKMNIGPGGHQRFARESDIGRLEQYREAYLAETGDMPPVNWNTLIEENKVHVCLIEGTVASIAIRIADTLEQVLIDGLFTFRPFRRKGLARQLVSAIARQASKREKSTAMLVKPGNKPVINLLDSLGFNKTADYLRAEFGASGKGS